MFPVTLHLSGRAVLVVGGGPVGRRKAASAAAAGGVVTVVDPAEPVAGPWAWVRETYCAEQLDGAWLVFACATPEVNRQVVADAELRRVWALNASDGPAGGFALPAVGRVGRVVVSVATGVPRLSAALRDRLVGHITADDAAVSREAEALRSRARTRNPSPDAPADVGASPALGSAEPPPRG